MAIVKEKLDFIAKFVKKPRIKTLKNGKNICSNGIAIVVAKYMCEWNCNCGSKWNCNCGANGIAIKFL